MGFFKSLERKVFRPVGRGLKAAAPVIGGVAGSFIPGVGNVVGSALGSAIGGQLKKGRFDAGALFKDAGVGVLTGGVMNKLGGGSFLGGMGKGAANAGASADDVLNSLPDVNMAARIGSTGAKGIARAGSGSLPASDLVRSMAQPMQSGGFRAGVGNLLKDGKTIKAIGDTALGGYQAVQQNRMMEMEREQMERRNAIEDEERRRREAMDPMRGQLLAALMQRLGMGGGMV